ncbi:hypothetical protein CVT26_013849 [Gymnopilus dilepis]|uniref:Uncharacterized protein n=1 Tax=Gymnopilus dilepis TaxID=231916 RepID=A0A409VVT9_9AGAR|nr:hypothetical protein CVT26_013849 [Gymnopilus dilepis]
MLDWTSVHRLPNVHLRAFLSFFCVLLSIQYTLGARINVLSQPPEGSIFAFSHDPRIQYLAAAQSVATINLKQAQITTFFPWDSDSEAPTGQLLSPATSVWIRGSSTSLTEQVEAYREAEDDVWNVGFLETLFVFNHGASTVEVDEETHAWLRSLKVKRLFLSGSINIPAHGSIPTYRLTDAPSIPAGPFVVSITNASEEMSLHNVYRLYVDEYDAFVFGAIPDLVNGGWLPTNLTTSEEDGFSNQIIPVPSRLSSLFSPDAPSKPLAGLRFALKDIFDAHNLPTAGGSLSYLLTHPSPPNRTAPSILPLLALGATLLGKTRTSQFAHGAQPWEFVDYSYSYNPRGDGWLTAAASSSGSACAVAGYEWLDFAVGSDTRGSVRKPAALVGVFGIRPSWGSLGLEEGVVPLSEEMDTVGFFARDVWVFWEVAMHWYAGSEAWNRSPRTRFPRKLYYPTDHFPMSNPAAQALVDTFISRLQTYPFNIQTFHVNFTSILTPLLPNGSFAEFQRFSNRLAEYRSWVSVGRPTREAFWERFGREPGWDPVPKRMFEKAKGISEEEFEEAVRVKRAFSGAVNEHIFEFDEESCSDSLFIYDAATGGVPSYRVEEMNYLSGSTPFLMNAPVAPNTNAPSTLPTLPSNSFTHSPPSPRTSDFFNFLASMGELPEVAIPIGQAEYFSPVSRAWEPVPVAVQVVARRGCDAVLVDLVRALGESRGGVRGVGVGRSMF